MVIVKTKEGKVILKIFFVKNCEVEQVAHKEQAFLYTLLYYTSHILNSIGNTLFHRFHLFHFVMVSVYVEYSWVFQNQ